MPEITSIIERAGVEALSVEDQTTLKAAIDTLALLTQELESKNTSINRLRQMLFGNSSEKTSKVLNDESSTSKPNDKDKDKTKSSPKKPGHGRNGTAAYTGADKIKVPHPELTGGEQCSFCKKGKMNPVAKPTQLIRITAMPPIGASIYECDKYRCSTCGEISTAPAPEGVGNSKYDASVTSMIGLLKYGTGLPFYRIEKLQQGFGIPLPSSTQWDLVKAGAKSLSPIFEELINQAAQGEVLYNDDTTMKILKMTQEQRAAAAADNAKEDRTGTFTSGIVSTQDENKIALFFTGVKHAGENLSDVLARRSEALEPPIQMSDALSRNVTGEFETILANCNAHSRRKYVEVASQFPEECRFVLETLSDVYGIDEIARSRKLSDHERLKYHQEKSGPMMSKLEKWLVEQIEGHKVEPNSGLGEAILYMQKHWEKLTLFLRVAGAPLDNNICERALKKAILNRKNAMFYRTLKGARVGDLYMSFIHTCELNGINPFDYFKSLLKNADEAAENPEKWMPWEYLHTLEKIQIRSSEDKIN